MRQKIVATEVRFLHQVNECIKKDCNQNDEKVFVISMIEQNNINTVLQHSQSNEKTNFLLKNYKQQRNWDTDKWRKQFNVLKMEEHAKFPIS